LVQPSPAFLRFVARARLDFEHLLRRRMLGIGFLLGFIDDNPFKLFFLIEEIETYKKHPFRPMSTKADCIPRTLRDPYRCCRRSPVLFSTLDVGTHTLSSSMIAIFFSFPLTQLLIV
jgi:hypothetical protein